MSDEGIPQDVRRFIADHIRSVAVLEALLLMHGEPGREWSAHELSGKLRIDSAWIQREIADLAYRGIVAGKGDEPLRYVYDDNNVVHPIVSALAEAYAQRRVSVISLIFAKPTDAIQSFADAFKLRKDRQDG